MTKDNEEENQPENQPERTEPERTEPERTDSNLVYASWMANSSHVISFRLSGRQMRALANGTEIISPFKGTKIKLQLVEAEGLRCKTCGTRITLEEAESGDDNCPECWAILNHREKED